MLTRTPPRAVADQRYNIEETCSMLGICRNTLRKWTNEMKIKARTHPADGHLFYEGKEINRFWNQSI